jgi:hypothetical protein
LPSLRLVGRVAADMKPNRFSLFVACLIWTGGCLTPTPASGQAVVNGSFESPVLKTNHWKSYAAGESFGGWTVSLQEVMHWRVSPIPEFAKSNEGDTNQAVALDGALFQDLATAAGRDYRVSFRLMIFNGNDFPPPLRVSFGNAVALFRHDDGRLPPPEFSIRFTASNETTRLEFRSYGYGLGIDDVAVTPVSRLSVERLGGNLALVTWSTNFADSLLEYATCVSGTNWWPVTNGVSHSGERASVVFETTSERRFFRLRKP